ncbi:YkgJ family cysteine cluster protein [Methanococcoides orientis]|uniref:YkgJ family cysteine cluster protein n=1 Tax=Methanococcoides orientis TaxID=2822137 RepID=UPI001E28CD31|nr:YkgJ family cysteine cluster protein [Methanococcoides orientis]UGV41373.1 YkgJ family cysteine cluster protein [Methanococcoides orientis]
MNSVIMVKKAIHYNVIQNILQYYECPDTCKAECCRNGRVHIFEDEFNLLKENDHERTNGIRSDVLYPALYIMNNPCSFLNQINRCETYERRPTVCGMYPFKVNNSGTTLGLQPCPLGFMIIKDISSWATDTISKADIPAAEKVEKMMQWEISLESYAIEASEFHSRESLQEMQIPYDELEMLSMFLLSKNALKKIPDVSDIQKKHCSI